MGTTPIFEGKEAAVSRHLTYEQFRASDHLSLIRAPGLNSQDSASLRSLVAKDEVNRQLYTIFIEATADEIDASADEIAKMNNEEFYRHFSKPETLANIAKEYNKRVLPNLYKSAIPAPEQPGLQVPTNKLPIVPRDVPNDTQSGSRSKTEA
jgi:hypothetical protein